MAGIIAAADNIIGGRGVAPRATIYGYRLLARPGEGISAGHSSQDRAQAMIRNMSEDTAVSNNSWGYLSDNGYRVTSPPRCLENGR